VIKNNFGQHNTLEMNQMTQMLPKIRMKRKKNLSVTRPKFSLQHSPSSLMDVKSYNFEAMLRIQNLMNKSPSSRKLKDSSSKISIKLRKVRKNLKNMNVMNKTMITQSSRNGMHYENTSQNEDEDSSQLYNYMME